MGTTGTGRDGDEENGTVRATQSKKNARRSASGLSPEISLLLPHPLIALVRRTVLLGLSLNCWAGFHWAGANDCATTGTHSASVVPLRSSASSGTPKKQKGGCPQRPRPSNSQAPRRQGLVAVRFCPAASTSRLGHREERCHKNRATKTVHHRLRTVDDVENTRLRPHRTCCTESERFTGTVDAWVG